MSPFCTPQVWVSAASSAVLASNSSTGALAISWVLAGPQPALIRAPGTPFAYLRGDLWSGNFLWDTNADATTSGVLIDPMPHGSYTETDLAMFTHFGYPYLDEIIRGYDKASPLIDGWRERVSLHQLVRPPLHCVPYGDTHMLRTLPVDRRYA